MPRYLQDARCRKGGCSRRRPQQVDRDTDEQNGTRDSSQDRKRRAAHDLGGAPEPDTALPGYRVCAWGCVKRRGRASDRFIRVGSGKWDQREMARRVSPSARVRLAFVCDEVGKHHGAPPNVNAIIRLTGCYSTVPEQSRPTQDVWSEAKVTWRRGLSLESCPARDTSVGSAQRRETRTHLSTGTSSGTVALDRRHDSRRASRSSRRANTAILPFPWSARSGATSCDPSAVTRPGPNTCPRERCSSTSSPGCSSGAHARRFLCREFGGAVLWVARRVSPR